MADRLCFLGTGDSEAMDYWNTNLLLETAGRRLLIDCGYTIKYALRDMGLGVPDIDGILITHIHADHCFGLERFAYETRYTHGTRIPLYLPVDIYPGLWEQTLKGSMGHSSDGENRLDDFFDLQLIEDRRLRFGDATLELFPTDHTGGMATYGVIINNRLIFTSDTNPLPWLAADRSDRRIVHDCSLQAHNPVHATLDEIADFYPPEVRARMLAIHYGDAMPTRRAQIEAVLAGVAEQGGCIDV